MDLNAKLSVKSVDNNETYASIAWVNASIPLAAVNGFGATNVDQRREFVQSSQDSSVHPINALAGTSYWLQKVL